MSVQLKIVDGSTKKHEVKLDAMNGAELKQLIADAQKALNTVDTRRKLEARQAAEQVAREHGFTLDELMKLEPKKMGSKGAPKYMNPADQNQTWTGRGRPPKWYCDVIESGKTVDSMKI